MSQPDRGRFPLSASDSNGGSIMDTTFEGIDAERLERIQLSSASSNKYTSSSSHLPAPRYNNPVRQAPNVAAAAPTAAFVFGQSGNSGTAKVAMTRKAPLSEIPTNNIAHARHGEGEKGQQLENPQTALQRKRKPEDEAARPPRVIGVMQPSSRRQPETPHSKKKCLSPNIMRLARPFERSEELTSSPETPRAQRPTLAPPTLVPMAAASSSGHGQNVAQGASASASVLAGVNTTTESTETATVTKGTSRLSSAANTDVVAKFTTLQSSSHAKKNADKVLSGLLGFQRVIRDLSLFDHKLWMYGRMSEFFKVACVRTRSFAWA